MKKLLALVLALVMVMGLATVGTSAAFSDADSIEYKEAVDVMSAIGVIAGMDDGSFNPTGSLTREQGAKILSYMLMGGKTGGDALTASRAPFTDVAANRWSAGAIAYCANAGILAGDGTGKFNPEAPLTGYAFAKMLLTALGYNAEREGLVGADWELNAIKLVNRVDLANGLSGMLFSNTITREQAAKLALNTCMATMVEYSGNLTTDAQGNLTARRENVANTAYSYATNGTGTERSGNITEGAALGAAVAMTNGDMQFIENYFPNTKLVIGTNDFGETTHDWYTASTRTDYIKTAAKTVASEPVDDAVVTYTAKTKEAVVKEDLDGYTLGLEKQYMFIDGTHEEVVAPGEDPDDASEIVTAVTGTNGIEDITANGRVVKVYDVNKDMVIDKIVVINADMAKVTAVSDKDKTVTYRITASGLSASGATITTATGYGEVAKNDYVMINRAVNAAGTATASNVTNATYKTTDTSTTAPAVLAVTPATKVTGAITKTTLTTGTVTDLTIDGTVYKTSVIARTAVTGAAVSSTSYDTYLDAFGYAVDTTATSVKKDVAYLVGAVGTIGATLDGDNVTVTVRAVLEDGTVGSYKLATYKLKAADVADDAAYDGSNDDSAGAYATVSTHSVNMTSNTGNTTGTATFEVGDVVIKNTNIRVYKVGQPTKNVDANLNTSGTGALADLDAVYAYKLNDAGDTMTLTAIAPAVTAMTADVSYRGSATVNTTIKSTTSYTITGTNTASALINSDTAFVVYDSSDKVAKVYTGNSALPAGTINLGTAQFVIVPGSAGNVGKTQVVFATVGGGISATSSSNIVYVDYSETSSAVDGSKTVTTYKAYQPDGTVIWLKDASSTVFDNTSDGLFTYADGALIAKKVDNSAGSTPSPTGTTNCVYSAAAQTVVDGNMISLGGTGTVWFYMTDDTQVVYLSSANTDTINGKNVFAVIEVGSDGNVTSNVATIYVTN